MVNEASVSEPCGLWAAHPGCTEEVNNRRSRNFLLSSSLCLENPAKPRKTYLHTHRHLPGAHTLTHIFSDTQTAALLPPPSRCVHVQL